VCVLGCDELSTVSGRRPEHLLYGARCQLRQHPLSKSRQVDSLDVVGVAGDHIECRGRAHIGNKDACFSVARFGDL